MYLQNSLPDNKQKARVTYRLGEGHDQPNHDKNSDKDGEQEQQSALVYHVPQGVIIPMS